MRLMPTHFRRMSHSQVVRTLDTEVGGRDACEIIMAAVRYWHPAHEAIRSCLESTLMPVHGDILSCHLHTKYHYSTRLNHGHPCTSKLYLKYNSFTLMVHIKEFYRSPGIYMASEFWCQRYPALACFNTLGSRQNGRQTQMTFSSAFSWMKMCEFPLKFHWNMFLRIRLTIFQHWFR